MPFMQPQIYRTDYFSVNTSMGTEIVPCDVIGPAVPTAVSALSDYLEGTPDATDEMCEVFTGYLARLSAPGYMDCTDWSAHATADEAREYLREMYGDDDTEGDES